VIFVLVLVFIIIRVLFLSIIFPFLLSLFRFQVTGDNSEGSYSDGCRDNILDGI
jgi:hypothetical protein